MNNKFAALKRDKPAPAPDPKLMRAFVEGSETRSTEIVPIEPEPEATPKGSKRVGKDGAELVQINARLPRDVWLKYKMYCLKENITMQDHIIAMVQQLPE